MYARLFAIVVIAAYIVLVAPALAGTYDVAACDAAGGANHSWAAQTNNSFVPAYQICPSFLTDSGLVTRASGQAYAATVPTGAAARWVFRAPPGALIVGVRARGTFSSYNRDWDASLRTDTTLIAGCSADRYHTNPCASSVTDGTPLWTSAISPATTTLTLETECTYGPCPVSHVAKAPGGVYARAILYSAVVTLLDGSAPSVSGASGAAWTGQWLAGRPPVSFNSTDNVGIQEVRASIDGQVLRAASRTCDPADLRCPDWPGVALDVPTTDGIRDGRHTLALTAVDRAGNVGGISRTVLVDNTPPSAPISPYVAGGSGWRNTNSFSVGWRNPSQGAGAPITGVRYSICPSGRATGCILGTRDLSNVQALTGLRVPSKGAWELRIWLRDAAGNARPETAAAPLPLRFDDDAPSVVLLPRDASAPAKIRVAAADATSGIARVEIGLRRHGTSAWSDVPAVRDGTAYSVVLDDEHLPDGLYDLRANAVDAAGNEHMSELLSTGSTATVHLPVRVKVRLLAGERTIRHRGRRGRHRSEAFITTPRVRVGAHLRLRGRLIAPGGNALQGALIEVSARTKLPGAVAEPVAVLTTSRSGRFQYNAPAGPTRTLIFHYAGTPLIRPQTRTVALRVPASSTLRTNRSRVVNGETVRFTGRLRGGWVPSVGKLIEVQFYARGKWRTFATTRSDDEGRWRYEYRFDGTRGTVRWRFRARMPQEIGYPFATGASRQVRVTVRGL